MFGIDCTGTGNNAAALRSAGVRFAGRYLAPPGKTYDWKRLSRSEADRLRQVGVTPVTVFESSANRALDGHAAGVQDAQTAISALRALNAPSSAACYFAVDFDATEAQQTRINAYLAAAASVIGKNRTGVYGSYYVVKRSLQAGVCKYGWQTYAWSGGQWFKGAHIRQYRNGQKIVGLSVDYNASTTADFGQWQRPMPIPRPKPKFAVHVLDDRGNLVKAFTTRSPATVLAKWGIARHQPKHIEILRLRGA